MPITVKAVSSRIFREGIEITYAVVLGPRKVSMAAASEMLAKVVVSWLHL
jgi:hypothetical protein